MVERASQSKQRAEMGLRGAGAEKGNKAQPESGRIYCAGTSVPARALALGCECACRSRALASSRTSLGAEGFLGAAFLALPC